MKTFKFFKAVFFTLLFLWWFFLSHVTFNGSFNEKQRYEPQKSKYYVVFYNVMPINPMGLYFFIWRPGGSYAVLYDKKGKYLGQSSPFEIADMLRYGESFMLSDELKSESDGLGESFMIYYSHEYVDDYRIFANRMKWWSVVLSVLH